MIDLACMAALSGTSGDDLAPKSSGANLLLPAEQALDVGEFELDVGRPAVVALAGVRRLFHLAQQRVHLLGLELASGAHRAVAGERRGDMHEPALERQRLVPFGHVLGKVAHQRARVDLAQQRRRLAHRHRAGTERLDREPVTAKLVGARDEALDLGRRKLDDLRDQQDLAGNAGLLQRRLHALVDDAPMRGAPAPAGRAGERRQSQLHGARSGRNAAMVALPPVVAARRPSRESAAPNAWTISARTRPPSRKRTSALAGCTLTSTSRASSATNRATIGWRSRGR